MTRPAARGAVRDYRAVIGSVRGLRRGLTTGTCATAAAKGAALALLEGRSRGAVSIRLPPGKKPYAGAAITVPLASVVAEGYGYRASVIKDSGDDDDATNGIEIRAFARIVDAADGSPAVVRGGEGVGVVERPGLPVPVGEPAINPVPRSMIEHELSALVAKARKRGALSPAQGLEATISVPYGAAVASRTWNPRIGVRGGISIIGTSGVIEPKSSAAFKKSIDRTIRAFHKAGVACPIITPGYVGERYLRARGVPDERVASVGDQIGFSLLRARAAGFEDAALVGHLGKMVKIAAGIFNTHCRYGDARLETIAAYAAAEGASAELAERLLSLKLAEEAAPILIEAGLSSVFGRIARRAAERASEHSGLRVSCVILALDASELGRWPEPSGVADAEALP